MTRWVAIIPLVLVLALGGVFALNIGRDSSVIPSALIGKPVPDFNLPPLPGRETGLSGGDFTGSGVSVLNVFASWCVPCRAEHPVIAQLAEQTGIPVYGLNYKERDPADGGRWLEDLGDPYTSSAWIFPGAPALISVSMGCRKPLSSMGGGISVINMWDR